MNEELIDKLLSEQATAEEEHLLAQMLRTEENIEQWLVEDETATYDRIVSQRRAKRRVLRWFMAAALILLVAAGTLVLWPKNQVTTPIVTQEVRTVTEPDSRDVAPPVAVATTPKPAVPPKKTVGHRKQKTTASTTDSLQYYIARLEKELENVNESTYSVKAEQVIRADARLQRLVQRIMIGELTKENVPTEALNANNTTEERP